MKRTMIFIICAVLLFALTACNSVETIKLNLKITEVNYNNNDIGVDAAEAMYKNAEFEFTNSSPTVENLLYDLEKAGHITLVKETNDDNELVIIGINNKKLDKQEDGNETVNSRWVVEINGTSGDLDKYLGETLKEGDEIKIEYRVVTTTKVESE